MAGFGISPIAPAVRAPADALTFGIPQANETGLVDNYDIPRWLYDMAGPVAPGTLGFGNDILAGRNMTLRPGAVGDTTYKVGNMIFSGAHGGGLPTGNGMDAVSSRFLDPNSFVSYENSPLYQQALKTGQWSILNGTPYNVLDQNGRVIETKKFEGLEDSDNMDEIAMALTGAALGGMAMTAAGGAGGAGAAGGGGAQGAAGAGVTGFGDAGAMYGGLDAAGAASLGGGASVGGFGAGAAGAGGAVAAGAGGGGGGGILGAIKSGAASLFGGGGGMSWTDLIGPALNAVGGAFASDAAGDAADAQAGAAREGIAENRRQFDLVRQLLSPYVNAGSGALGSYQALSGALGPQKQQQAIEALQGTPQFGQLVKQGEDAILQNASATGGLRGGNTQNSLADYRTRVLSGLIDQQLGRYGGLLQVGQNSAVGVGNQAMNTGNLNAQLMQQIGAANAGGTLASSRYLTDALGGIGGFFAGRGAAPAAAAPSGQFGTGVVYPEITANYGGGF